MKEQGFSPKARAQIAFNAGEGQDSNPYPKGTPEREEYALAMGKLQYNEFLAEQQELRAGV
jgi:hypothetical protein